MKAPSTPVPINPTDAAALTAVHALTMGARAWTQAMIAASLTDPQTWGLLIRPPIQSSTTSEDDDRTTGGPNQPVAGFILCRLCAEECEIITFAVIPTFQRQRYGHILLTVACQHAAMRGARDVFLEVAADNIAALALYTLLGFIQIGYRPNYYPRADGPAVAALLMRRNIDSK